MGQMRQRSRTFHCPSCIVPHASAWARWARRATAPPVLTQLLGQLLAGGGPVIADVVPKLDDVAFEVQLVFLEPADVEFLPRSTTLELACNVFLVVSDDSGLIVSM